MPVANDIKSTLQATMTVMNSIQ